MKSFFDHNMWFKIYSIFFVFNTVGGVLLANKIIEQSSYLAFLSVLILVSAGSLFFVWLLWFSFILFNLKRSQSVTTAIRDVVEAKAYIKKVKRNLVLGTVLWFVILVVVSAIGKSTVGVNNYEGLYAALIISWPALLLLLKYKLNKIDENDISAKEKMYQFANNGLLIFIFGFPLFLFFAGLTLLFITYLFFNL